MSTAKRFSWYYLCCGKDRNYQMKVYPPTRTGGEYVMANIWAHDNKWGAVEWWENGVKVGQMEAHDALDPDYVDLYATVTEQDDAQILQARQFVPHVPDQTVGRNPRG